MSNYSKIELVGHKGDVMHMFQELLQGIPSNYSIPDKPLL
jgi:hypothetical protein